MRATIYVHSSKESNRRTGEGLGLVGEALEMFVFAAVEVKLTMDVDEHDGTARIVEVDDRPVIG